MGEKELIRQKIEEYLSSSDIEMIQLGATIMRYELPKTDWIALLERHAREEPTTLEVGDGKEPMEIPGPLRFRYVITEGEISIANAQSNWGGWNLPIPAYPGYTFAGTGTSITTGNFNVGIGGHTLTNTTTGSASTPIGGYVPTGSAFTSIMSTP